MWHTRPATQQYHPHCCALTLLVGQLIKPYILRILLVAILLQSSLKGAVDCLCWWGTVDGILSPACVKQ